MTIEDNRTEHDVQFDDRVWWGPQKLPIAHVLGSIACLLLSLDFLGTRRL